MPTPADIIKNLQDDTAPYSQPAAPSAASQPTSNSPPAAPQGKATTAGGKKKLISAPSDDLPASTALPEDNNDSARQPSSPVPIEADIQPASLVPSFASLRDIASYFEEEGAQILAARIKRHLRPVSFGTQKLEVMITGDNAEDLPQQVAKTLSEASGSAWLVSVSETGGGKTIAEEDADKEVKEKQAAEDLPLVARVLEIFDGAEITAIKALDSSPVPEASEAIEEEKEEEVPSPETSSQMR